MVLVYVPTILIWVILFEGQAVQRWPCRCQGEASTSHSCRSVNTRCRDARDVMKMYQLIGLREKLQENPIFHGEIYGFL